MNELFKQQSSPTKLPLITQTKIRRLEPGEYKRQVQQKAKDRLYTKLKTMCQQQSNMNQYIALKDLEIMIDEVENINWIREQERDIGIYKDPDNSSDSHPLTCYEPHREFDCDYEYWEKNHQTIDEDDDEDDDDNDDFDDDDYDDDDDDVDIDEDDDDLGGDEDRGKNDPSLIETRKSSIWRRFGKGFVGVVVYPFRRQPKK